MGTYSQYQTDPAVEKDGLILNLGEAGQFKIARAGGANKKFALKFKEVTAPYRRAIQTDSLDDETSQKLLRETYVDTVLLGWQGVTGADGKVLPHSRANALKLLADLPWLFEEIRRAAEDATLFRRLIQEADAGNSGASSATS